MNNKKNVKWYTYVSEELDSSLKTFMKENNLKNQAKIIRTAVEVYMKLINKFRSIPEIKNDISSFDKKIDELAKAPNLNLSKYQKILKQKLSPLKTSLLVLENQQELSANSKNLVVNAIKSLDPFEKFINSLFVENSETRFYKKFDILYVEDNELERETMTHYFQDLGINVVSVESAEEAIAILKTKTPKCFIIDLNLNTSSIQGDDLSMRLKTEENTKLIPLILISAIITKKDMKILMEKTHANELILKPIKNLEIIKNIIEKYL